MEQATIACVKISKRFGYQQVLKGLDFEAYCNQIIGVKGDNGSGKSTFLKIISGYLSPSSGTITYSIDGNEIKREGVFRHVSYSAPYISNYPLLTLNEVLNIYQRFKPSMERLTIGEFYEFLELPNQQLKMLKDYSSGMAQKVQLGLSILSGTEILLLDEPSSYLDVKAIDWFKRRLKEYSNDRLIIIASNEENDFELCNEKVSLDVLQVT